MLLLVVGMFSGMVRIVNVRGPDLPVIISQACLEGQGVEVDVLKAEAGNRPLDGGRGMRIAACRIVSILAPDPKRALSPVTVLVHVEQSTPVIGDESVFDAQKVVRLVLAVHVPRHGAFQFQSRNRGKGVEQLGAAIETASVQLDAHAVRVRPYESARDSVAR